MHVLRSPDINLVPFVSVDNMMRLVSSIGIELFLQELADRIEQDFERSRKMGDEAYKGKPWWFKVGVRLARLTAPIQ